MGRLPAQWAGRVIQDRFPYEFTGEITITSAQSGLQYPDATFQNTVDKPFEIHRMIPRVYDLEDTGLLAVAQPDQSLLAGLVRVRIADLGLDQIITKTATLLDVLTKGSSERTWEWADPHTITRSNQLQVVLDALTYPATVGDGGLRVAICFQGFLLLVAPPSENR